MSGEAFQLRRSRTPSRRRRHLRDDFFEDVVGDLAQLGVGAILDRVGHPHDRRFIAQGLGLDLGSLNECRGGDDGRGYSGRVEI